MKNYQNFLSENFHFLVLKFSVYLNRRVFMMKIKISCVLVIILITEETGNNKKKKPTFCQ